MTLAQASDLNDRRWQHFVNKTDEVQLTADSTGASVYSPPADAQGKVKQTYIFNNGLVDVAFKENSSASVAAVFATNIHIQPGITWIINDHGFDFINFICAGGQTADLRIRTEYATTPTS